VPRMMQHQVPENLLRHIGDITVSFALLENALQMVVHSLVASSQRIGQIITAELGFKNLRALSIGLYKERLGEGDKFDQFRARLRRAAEAEDERNQITHSLWAAGDSPETITRIKTTAKEKHGIRFHFESVNEIQLSDFASELKILASDIQSFWLEMLGVTAAKPNSNVSSE
jgi:hypothetical protein